MECICWLDGLGVTHRCYHVCPIKHAPIIASMRPQQWLIGRSCPSQSLNKQMQNRATIFQSSRESESNKSHLLVRLEKNLRRTSTRNGFPRRHEDGDMQTTRVYIHKFQTRLVFIFLVLTSLSRRCADALTKCNTLVFHWVGSLMQLPLRIVKAANYLVGSKSPPSQREANLNIIINYEWFSNQLLSWCYYNAASVAEGFRKRRAINAANVKGMS